MQRKALAIIYLTIFIDLLCVGIVIPILPSLVVIDLGLKEYVVGLIAAILPFMQFIFAPIWGNLSDKKGRKPIMLMSIAINIFASVLFVFSNQLIFLVLSRVLSGVGSANFSTAQAYISDISPPQLRTKNIGIVSSAFGLGFILGPGIGGYLKSNFGIEYIGYLTCILTIINLIFVYFVMPESNKTIVARNIRTNVFKNITTILKNRNLQRLFLIHALFISAFSMMQIASPLLWKSVFDLSDLHIGYLFSFIGLCSVFVQAILVGFFSKKIGENKMILLGSVTMILGLIMMPLVSNNNFIPIELLAILTISIANGLIIPATNTLVSQTADDSNQGMTLGALQSFSSLTRTLGPLLSGILFMKHFTLPFFTGAFLLVFCLILALKINTKTKEMTID
jgi:multidrug resistance protein